MAESREYATAFFIGRFQPFHYGHVEVALQGLRIADKLVFVIGSSGSARTTKNPFTFNERVDMIRGSFTPETWDRIRCVQVRDYFNDDNHWIADVQVTTRHLAPEGASVALLGDYKDSSSYYLKYFPQWEFVPTRSSLKLNATDIRNAIFDGASTPVWDDNSAESHIDWESKVPEGTLKIIQERLFGPGNETRFSALLDEHKMLRSYKEKWAFAPFPPTFVTTDAVVVCAGHVLVVRRKFAPGKGCLALPGGFLKQNERLEACAVRELREETGIKVKASVLKGCIKDSHVFDHPGRSLRGRTITHGFYFKLDGVVDSLPEVRGGDDAEDAFWLPLMDVTKREDEWFEDHMHLVSWFMGR